MMNHLLQLVGGTHWAIEPGYLSSLMAVAELKAAATPSAARSRTEPGRIAVVPLMGVLTPRPSWFQAFLGGTAMSEVGRDLDQIAADKSIDTVVLFIDSPGGSVAGTPELANTVYQLKQRKKVISAIEGLGASAAYWIASQASEVWASPSSDVGSIGVLALHTDESQANEKEGVKVTLISSTPGKVEGNPYEPLSDPARAHLQERVNEYYEMFLNSVAKGRGVSPTVVKTRYGEGRTLGTRQALAAGMVDRTGTLAELLAHLTTGGTRGKAEAKALTRSPNVIRKRMKLRESTPEPILRRLGIH